MKQYILNGASQYGFQWDGSKYVINHGEIVTQATNRIFRQNLFAIKSDGRIVKIADSVIERYFTEIGIGE